MSESGLEQLLVPQYQKYQNISGGINVSQPPDEIGDTESPDLQNLIYINGVLQVDTGYSQYGNRVVGNPLQPIQWELTSGQRINCLVTTNCFYVYNNTIKDWQIALPNYYGAALNNPPGGSGWTPWQYSFSSAFGPQNTTPPTFTLASAPSQTPQVGDIIQVALRTVTGSGYYTSTVAAYNAGTLTITAADPYLPGQYTATNAYIKLFSPLYSGDYPISWTVDPTTNTLIWTNGMTSVQAYQSGGTTGPLAGLSSIANTALLVTRFYGYTLAIGTTEGGTPYPYRVRRSTNVSSTDWTSAAAGYDNLTDTADAIISCAVIGPYLVLGREQSIMTGQYYGIVGQTFFWQYNFSGMGTTPGNSIAQMKMYDALISQSGVYLFQGGYVVQSIGDKVFNYFLGPKGDLSPENIGNLFSLYVYQLDELWIFYPTVNSSTGYCDKLLRYSFKFQSWFPQIFTASAWAGGCFVYRTAGIEWSNETRTWENCTNTWTARTVAGNYPTLLLADYPNRVVQNYDFVQIARDLETTPWYFVSKDYPVLNELLLFDGIVAYGLGNNVSVAVSTDYGQTWDNVGTFNFGTSFYTRQVLDFQVSGSFFRFKVSGVGYGFFLSQFALRYLSESEF